MEVCTFNFDELNSVMLGRQGENGVRQIVIDLGDWSTVLDGPDVMIVALRPGEDSLYVPAGVTVSGSEVTWEIDSVDTALDGAGYAEIRLSKDGAIKKSRKFTTKVVGSLMGNGEPAQPQPPEWAAEIMQSVETATTAAEGAAADAAAAASEAASASSDAAAAAAQVTEMADEVTDLKSAFDFSNNEQAKISDDLYGSHAVYIDFNVGRYAINGYNLSIKSYAHSTAKYPAGTYIFPTPPAGIDYSIIQYVSDSAGTNVVSYRDAALTGTIPDGCIISIRKQNGNDFTESDLQTIQHSWIVTKNGAETGASKLSKIAPAIVDTASGAVASFDDGADGIPVQKLIVNINPVQAGSGDPSPDNVRPISGRTGAVIERTGVNVWDEKWELGSYSNTGVPIGSTDRIRCKNFIGVKPNTTYFFKCNIENKICFYDATKSFISTIYDYKNTVFVTPANCRYLRFALAGGYGIVYNHDISINYPATNTDYEPYQGNQISVAFPSSAGTVYQGTATYNGDGTWTILSEYAFFDEWASLQRGNVNTDGTGRVFNRSFSTLSKFAYGAKMISNVLKAVENPGNWESLPRSSFISNMGTYFVMCTNNPDDTIETMLNWAANVQLLMKLKTPVQVTVTTEQLLTTLHGTNNIWSDTGDATVDYVADTKLYIEKLTQPTEDDMTADHLITSGTFFMIGNSLYLATAQIAAGATITPGTNATKLSLADALNTLNS